MRLNGSRYPVVVALGLLPLVLLGGMCGCDSTVADGSQVEEVQVSAEQKAEIRAQRERQKLERQKNALKKNKKARG